MKAYQLVLFSFLILLACNPSKEEITEKDYQRAVDFMYANYQNKTAFNLTTSVNWFQDGSGFWFIDYSKKGRQYQTVDFKNQKVEVLFDHSKLAIALSKTQQSTIEPYEISISGIEREANGGLSFMSKGQKFTWHEKTEVLQKIEAKKAKPTNPYEALSPDGKWIAFVKDYNLFIKSTRSKRSFQLSTAGKKGYEYASYYGWDDIMEGENGERPQHFYVDWSPDSKYIATSIVDYRNAEKMYLLNWSIDSLYKPKLLSYYRGSPGDTSMVHVVPVFFDVSTKKEIKTKLPRGTHINSVSTQWTDKPGVLFANYPERGYKKHFLKQVNLQDKTEQVLIKEAHDTNVDNFSYRYLRNQEKLVFFSERSGWKQLYIFDLNTQKTQALTQGDYYVNEIKFIDEAKGLIYFLASGKEVNSNPYHQKLYVTDLKGSVQLLTAENTHHNINFAPSGAYFVDSYSTVNIPTKTVLRSAETGEELVQLTQADVSELTARGWKSPEIFELLGKDQKTTIYGAIWKPSNFDASKKYPIIDHSYTGPHTQVFPKSFDRALANQALSELGFIVVMVDGLGTSGRSKAFHDVSYKNMGNNLEDHVLAIRYLATKYSWINGEKVGIFGHSAGGFDAGHAMVAFPDFYKVAVASSADHDFRMEKAWWPEMYMGWPVDESYEAVSNITMAKNLKGKLLLVHGGIDENVNPSATFKFAEALVQADKEFDLLILPSQRHGYQGQTNSYFTKKRWNYFIEHLAEKKPIWNFKWK